jgi:DNA-binding transcriptional regulator YiaG
VTEEWRAVVGFEGFYAVSSLGRVMRLKTASGAKSGRILKPVPDHKGYLRVRLSCECDVTTHKVHRLVADAFIGPSVGLEVNHKDHDRQNNAASNLEYVTPKGNSLHKTKAGRAVRGERVPQAKLTDGEVVAIRAAVGVSQTALAAKYGVSRRAIQLVLNGKTWTHV